MNRALMIVNCVFHTANDVHHLGSFISMLWLYTDDCRAAAHTMTAMSQA
jgi:hypothetical protein